MVKLLNFIDCHGNQTAKFANIFENQLLRNYREVVPDASVGALWCLGTQLHAERRLLEEGLPKGLLFLVAMV